ncbi:14926_t:CDS:1 [Funneliformis mosseae]|uniref:14926_t:CDS:1 n=1 Tax=Funneliformis mosseae TaxID=27381 RepID=A0A9N8VPF0_FUNMO|nr:14926_t:CDS:1 [Funneliformis mosseae]
MNGNNTFHFLEPETSNRTIKEKPKKKEPNMFILFRKEMMKYKPYNNIPMTKYSKFVSEIWKNLSEIEKLYLQRKYQINRDQKLRQEHVTGSDQCNVIHERGHKHIGRLQKNVTDKIEITSNHHVLNTKVVASGLIRDCFFTESPPDFINDDFLNFKKIHLSELYYDQSRPKSLSL